MMYSESDDDIFITQNKFSCANGDLSTDSQGAEHYGVIKEASNDKAGGGGGLPAYFAF